MNGAGGFLRTRLFSAETTERGDAEAFPIAAAMAPASWDPSNSFRRQSIFARTRVAEHGWWGGHEEAACGSVLEKVGGEKRAGQRFWY